VIEAYSPLQVAGLRWVIAAKQDVAEAFASATSEFARQPLCHNYLKL
jgi:hypothetical protein